MTEFDGRKVVLVVVVSQSCFAALALCWALWRHLPISLHLTSDDLGVAIVACCPLLLLGFLLNGRWCEKSSVFSQFANFRDEMTKPLASSLSLKQMLLVSLCAGVGEELFFRGPLLAEFGIVTSSALFSLLHLGALIKKYSLVALLYLLVGVYFALLVQYTRNLAGAMITHALYDFIALYYLHSWDLKKANSGFLSFYSFH